jgi:SAM-dependent methyltransferase
VHGSWLPAPARIFEAPNADMLMRRLTEAVARSSLSRRIRYWLRPRFSGKSASPPPPVGAVRFGNLRRLEPLSRSFGFDRGLPVDRYYVERFLEAHANDIRGRVLEIEDDAYTRKFGGPRVGRVDILHAVAGNPHATFITDLTAGETVPSDAFDCVLLTQTLHHIYDAPSAIRTLHRILRPGGVLLATFPGLSQIGRTDMECWGWYWGFTSDSARRLFLEAFPVEAVQIKTFGNVLSATSFLWGIAAQELRPRELEYRDPEYELLVAVRAVKPFAA